MTPRRRSCCGDGGLRDDPRLLLEREMIACFAWYWTGGGAASRSGLTLMKDEMGKLEIWSSLYGCRGIRTYLLYLDGD